MPNSSRPNIVLLTVDALRADHVTSYGYDRETTPVLDEFAQDGLRFTHAFSPSSHTREAIPAILTGCYSDVCVDGSYSLIETSISEVLTDAGYTTGAFHSNPYISPAYGYDKGFNVFDDDLHFSNYKFITLAQRALDKLRNRHYADAETITNRALSFVRSATEPFFLWVHYMDPHGPYCPPISYQESYHSDTVSQKRASRMYKRAAVSDPDSITKAERHEMMNLYDGEIRYTDDQIGALLDGLRDLDVLYESIVLISSDHGDAFGERGFYGHPRRLDLELVHVPLLVWESNCSPMVVEDPVSTLDILPTILDSVEPTRSKDGDELSGVSLYKHMEASEPDRLVFSQVRSEDGTHRRFSARSIDGARFIEWKVDFDSNEYEIVDEWGDGSDELARQVRQHSQRRINNASKTEQQPVDTEDSARIEQRLEALGYKE